MLTTAPTLHVHRPSPTAAEYTVSTRPSCPTRTQRLLLALVHAARALLALQLALTLAALWRRQHPLVDARALDRVVLAAGPAGRLARAAAAAAPPLLGVLPACAAAALALARPPHTEERLLVLRGLGIQTSGGPSWWWWWWRRRGGPPGATTRFIPTERIQDVLINEAFRGFQVRCYLVVVVEGEEDVVVVFPTLLPRPRVVEEVWRGVRECLWGPRGELGGGGKGAEANGVACK
ncbi:GPI-GlcNAc transferase complex [Xylariomycetidae sp. FL0641]|nr:GPI-GlcNAc transferase complex [Xylariomycetidae sp. FL0641]